MCVHFHIIVFMCAFVLLLLVCYVYRLFVFKLSTHLVRCSLCAHLHIAIFKSTIVLPLVVCFVCCSFLFRSSVHSFSQCRFQFSYQLFVATTSICQCNGHWQKTYSWFPCFVNLATTKFMFSYWTTSFFFKFSIECCCCNQHQKVCHNVSSFVS
jgi:hypothetical protein